MKNLLVFFIFAFFLSAPLPVHAQITILPPDQCLCPADYYSREPFCPGLCVPVGSHPSSDSQCQAVGIPASGCREQETCILAAPGGKPECINNNRLKQVQLQACQGNARLSEVGRVGDEDSCPFEADCFTSTGAGGVICQKYVDCQTNPSVSNCPDTTTDHASIIRCGPNNTGMVCANKDSGFCSENETTICARDLDTRECRRICPNGQPATPVYTKEAPPALAGYGCPDLQHPPKNQCDAGFTPSTQDPNGFCRCQVSKPVNPGGNSGINCTADPEKCSSSAGTLCDPTLDPDNFWTTDKDGNRIPKPGNGVMTAIGCIPTDPKTLITKLMGFSAGIGGGIALLLMVFGAFQMMTAAGNPEAIKKGKDQFLAAAIGLLFVIFSALLLRIIGVDILNIPGFS